jgi:hypothetical protein
MNQETHVRGVFISYTSVASVVAAMLLLTGAVVAVYAITEAFYIASAWAKAHKEGLLFALLTSAIVGVTAARVKPIFQTWKKRNDEYLL